MCDPGPSDPPPWENPSLQPRRVSPGAQTPWHSHYSQSGGDGGTSGCRCCGCWTRSPSAGSRPSPAQTAPRRRLGARSPPTCGTGGLGVAVLSLREQPSTRQRCRSPGGGGCSPCTPNPAASSAALTYGPASTWMEPTFSSSLSVMLGNSSVSSHFFPWKFSSS